MSGEREGEGEELGGKEGGEILIGMQKQKMNK